MSDARPVIARHDLITHGVKGTVWTVLFGQGYQNLGLSTVKLSVSAANFTPLNTYAIDIISIRDRHYVPAPTSYEATRVTWQSFQCGLGSLSSLVLSKPLAGHRILCTQSQDRKLGSLMFNRVQGVNDQEKQNTDAWQLAAVSLRQRRFPWAMDSQVVRDLCC